MRCVLVGMMVAVLEVCACFAIYDHYRDASRVNRNLAAVLLSYGVASVLVAVVLIAGLV